MKFLYKLIAFSQIINTPLPILYSINFHKYYTPYYVTPMNLFLPHLGNNSIEHFFSISCLPTI